MKPSPREKHFIRAWRQYRGYSLRKFADMMESSDGVQLMSHANIGRIETGDQPYTQDFLEAAARALGVTTAQLLESDPTKDGEVIDLVRLIQDRNDATAIAVLRTLAGKAN